MRHVYMFLSDGGAGVGGRTEKASPCAWLWLWYGSCPTMTTLTVLKGLWRDLRTARNESKSVAYLAEIYKEGYGSWSRKPREKTGTYEGS